MLSAQADTVRGGSILDSVDLHGAAAAAAAAAASSLGGAASGGLPADVLGEPPRKLAVLGLPWETTEDTLRVYFCQFGALEHAEIMKDRYTGKSRGFGFVTFLEPASAQRALAAEHTIDGRRCEAKVALPKGEPSPPRTTRIFVARLPPSVSEGQFRAYFESFGKLADAYMPRDHSKQGYRGIGFVTYVSPDSVEKVMAVKHWLNGHEVAIDRATPKEEPSVLRSMLARLSLASNQRRSFDNGAGIIGPGLTQAGLAGAHMAGLNSAAAAAAAAAGLDSAFTQLRSLSEDRELSGGLMNGHAGSANGVRAGHGNVPPPGGDAMLHAALGDMAAAVGNNAVPSTGSNGFNHGPHMNGSHMNGKNGSDGLGGLTQQQQAVLRAHQALEMNMSGLGLHGSNAAAAAAAAATTAALQSLARNGVNGAADGLAGVHAGLGGGLPPLGPGGPAAMQFNNELNANLLRVLLKAGPQRLTGLSNGGGASNGVPDFGGGGLGGGNGGAEMGSTAAAVQQLMAVAAAQSSRRSLDSAAAAIKRLDPTLAHITAGSNGTGWPQRAGPRIFIGKLSKDTMEGDVKDYFMKFGYVMDVYLPKAKDNKLEHRGFGFVTFETEAAIQRVVSHGAHRLKGSTIAIDIAMPKVEDEVGGVSPDAGGSGGMCGAGDVDASPTALPHGFMPSAMPPILQQQRHL